MKSWDDWKHTHQPFELNYHSGEGLKWCSDELQFSGFWGAIFDFMGVDKKKSDDGARVHLIDIGCGPRPPFERFLPAADVTVVEPLADEYKKFTPEEWWDGVDVYSQMAETRIAELIGQGDIVMCWNCIDHTIGWRDILANIHAYARPDAIIAIATDFKEPHVGHPGFEREEFMDEILKLFNVQKKLELFQERDLALVLKKK